MEPPPLTTGPDSEPIVYADGSQEYIASDGLSSLILLPGVACGYNFTWPDAHVNSQNFITSLRVISAPA